MTKRKLKSGKVLTDELLDEWVKEAEAGYDPKYLKLEPNPYYRGRPSLSGKGESPRIQVRMDSKLAAALRERALKEDKSVSEVAREAVRRYLDAA